MVKEKAHREAAAPVRNDHQNKGDTRILETAEDPLDRSGDRIKELPACTIDQELSGNGGDDRVARIHISDGRAEKHRHRSRHRCSGEGHDKAGLFVAASERDIMRADSCRDEDGEGHRAGDGQHVDDRSEVIRNLVGSQRVRAITGKKYDDQTEKAHFHKNGKSARHADDQVLLDVRTLHEDRMEDLMPLERRGLQYDDKEKNQKETIGQHRRKTGTEPAQTRQTEMPIDEKIVEYSIDRRRHQEELHGSRRRACRIRQTAKGDDHGNEEDHAHHRHEIVARHICHFRFQRERRQKVIDEKYIGCPEQERDHKTDQKSAANHIRKPFRLLFTKKRRHERRSRHEQPHDGSQKRIEKSRAHRYACEVIASGMPRHGRIDKSDARCRDLRDQDRQHHG